MTKKLLLLFIFQLLFFSCKKNNKQPITQILKSEWQFKAVDSTTYHKAVVPGNVHTDLLSNALIPDPFIKNNELKLQWISENDWEYKTNFSVNDSILNSANTTLNFEGLDTYANIYLNDSLLLHTNNAFRQWEIDVKPILKKENELRIVFNNPTKIEESEKNKLAYKLPEGNRIFTRKAQFHYGWDWGPKFITSGIWRPVHLKAWDNISIDDVFIRQEILNDKKALLSAEITLDNTDTDKVFFDITVNDSLVSSNEIQLTKGKALYKIPFEIINPNKWWTHNLGTPYQYSIGIKIHDKKNVYGVTSIKKGLRTIELVKEDTTGKTFHFKLNGVPVYMKGANYIPQNSFQNNVSLKDYQKIIDNTLAANMNMLRVWGGGIYENDAFYTLCDEKGILIWQDFMFACAMYPGDKMFLENIKQEAQDNVKRLRNHCSIALWCGNNENSEGWHRWGWQNGKNEKEKELIWEGYQAVFNKILPRAVIKHTDDIPYWESSPKYGRGDNRYTTEGDAHDWWVWHDSYPFEHFENNVPKFMSEFGFQSFPSYQTIKYATQLDSINISSNHFKSHQKHHRGYELIEEYMSRNYNTPNNDEDYVYVSQLLQAYGITKGIEAQRRSKPYCMGSLYWQLNDCWPAASWSSIDYFGNWKALHYNAKTSFSDVLVSPKIANDSLEIYVINDKLENLNKPLSLKILDFDGKEIWSHDILKEVQANSSTKITSFALEELGIHKNKNVLVSSYNGVKRTFYFEKPKNLKLNNGKIQKDIIKVANGYKITISSTTLQKDVFLYTNTKGHFNDNFFDLLPNTPVSIFFKTDSSSLKEINIKSLNNISYKK